jgi:hypothetical protein
MRVYFVVEMKAEWMVLTVVLSMVDELVLL